MGARPASSASWSVRDEARGDYEAIHDLTRRAFATMSFSDQTEHEVIALLRAKGALAVSLVAESAAKLLGHVAFSQMLRDGQLTMWYALGPIAVEPEMQRRGIGSALIEAGLMRLRRSGADGCTLVGNPDYYSRFGFEGAPEFAPDGEPPQYFQILRFATASPPIGLAFDPAFYVKHAVKG